MEYSPKAFDLLLILTERRGQLVVKDDLIKRLCPGTFVEESNLAQLRKALGEKAEGSKYIVTVPSRGDRFAQTVRTIPMAPAEEDATSIIESHSRSRMVIEERARRWSSPRRL